MDEECQHCDCKDDADGVCNGSVVSDQLAVCVSIDHLAQALRCQHEVGAGHSAQFLLLQAEDIVLQVNISLAINGKL